LDKLNGMRIALRRGVRVSLVPRLLLIVMPLTITAARLHAHSVDAVDATQEVNRCLRLVNVAAAKRHTSRRSPTAARKRTPAAHMR
jgi:hypothetical protein